MNYLQKTYDEASKKKGELEKEIKSLRKALDAAQDEHKTIVKVLRSLEKGISLQDIKTTPKKSNKANKPTDVQRGYWAELVTAILKGKGKLTLHEIVEVAVTKSNQPHLSKDDIRKRIMNALTSLRKRQNIDSDPDPYRTKYYLTSE